VNGTPDLHHSATATFVYAAALRRLIDEGLAQRIAEAEGGLSAQRLSMAAPGGDRADPTAGSALAPDDAARHHQLELATAVDQARAHLAYALSIAGQYPPPHVADAVDRAELARINGRGESCCQNCARTRRPDGEPRWEPIDARRAEASTVDGRLAEPLLLCRWCYDRVASWGRLPTFIELERHHRGERVPWPDDIPRREVGA